MGKNKNKALNLSRCDKTVLGVIATLNTPKRLFATDAERTLAQVANIRFGVFKVAMTPNTVLSHLLKFNALFLFFPIER